ncbi:ComEA family DNA-binding protein [Vibrio paucivorans]
MMGVSSGLAVADSDQYEGIEITVNINQANADELATLLKGIGIKKAQAIVDYRDNNGDFKSADELVGVSGIGQTTVDKNRERIQL